jgi:hypothetical protein
MAKAPRTTVPTKSISLRKPFESNGLLELIAQKEVARSLLQKSGLGKRDRHQG